MTRSGLTIGMLALMLPLVGCHGGVGLKGKKESKSSSGDAAAAEAATAPVAADYIHQVKPILDAKCVGCHAPDRGAPFPLTTFAEVQPRSQSIAAAVSAKAMPPWLAASGCNEYQHDISLTADEIALVKRWADAQAPRGDGDEPAPQVPPERSLSRVDVEVKMSAPYAPTQEPDEYRCFVMDWEPKETTYVTGFGVKPGNKAIDHHAILFLAQPSDVPTITQLVGNSADKSYPCFGGPGTPGFPTWLGAWAPGITGSDMPTGTGLKVPAGSRVILQMHYHTQGQAVPLADLQSDQTAVQLKLDKSVAKEAVVIPWFDYGWLTKPDSMKIPAGEASVKHAFLSDPTGFTNGKAINVYMAGLHMHVLGKSAFLTLQRKDGSSECLLNIPKWDFNWQAPYWLDKQIRINPGDQLGVQCEWDNSADHQPVIDGKQKTPADVGWGEGTNDEMCLGFVYATFAD